MRVVEILKELIAFPSVVGRPNGAIVAWIRAYLAEHGIKATIVNGPEGDRANLFATIGPKDVPGYILSGHMDVVPADEAGWNSDPFALKKDGETLYGRGTSDMKGFLAAVLAAVPQLTQSELKTPIHIAFSYDEEAGCRGVPHLLAKLPELCAPPRGAIIGEPSGMQGVLAHKGKASVAITLHGKSGHASRPDLGLNAIHAMGDLINAARKAADDLTNGPFDETFAPPYSTLQIGKITGGRALNIIPDECRMEVEARAISSVAPSSLLEPLRHAFDALEERGLSGDWEQLSQYPALSLDKGTDLAALTQALSGQNLVEAVSYGTEAGLYQKAGIDAIICGPGDIGRAHKPNEYILKSELAACQNMLAALGEKCR